MPKSINEYKILIIGFSCHDGDPKFEVGQDVELLVKGVVRKVEQSDNDDGTIDVCYKIKQLVAEQKPIE